jgi:peroxiredoxin
MNEAGAGGGVRLRSWLRALRYAALSDLRNPGLRLLGALGFIAAGGYAWTQGPTAGSTGVLLATWLGRTYGVACCLWFAYAAIRDLDPKLGAALRSKPMDGAAWVTLRWLAGLAVWLTLMAAGFLGAALGQLLPSGLASVASHALAFFRAALLLCIIGSLSFAASRLFRSPLGGIIVMFAWFCTIAGLQYIPAYMRPEYQQNRVFFLPAAASLVALTGLIVERFRRGELRRPFPPVVGVLILATLATAGAGWASRATPGYLSESEVIWDGIAQQHILVGDRTPGFWLPDGKGGRVDTASHHGKILLIFIFAADDPESARTLPALDRVAREFRNQGVQPIGVCLSLDQGDGAALSLTGGYSFPIGSDITAVKTSAPPDSAVASAYDVDLLPHLIVTDRRRRVKQILKNPLYTADDLRRIVQEELAGTPVPGG